MASKRACIGCDSSPGRAAHTKGPLEHPMVAIVRSGEAWEAKPVCRECWIDPEHRKKLIKGHFFERAAAQRALDMAGSDTIQG